ncbi:MAG: hypothetical protein LBS05_06845 [Tannerellaceae bacterium]|jgi:hypothetical protein|nr:hypothetical protein [Tannerellaceae bacterium]
MKKLFLTVLPVIMAVMNVSAQQFFFSTSEGQVLVYAHKNGKGKTENYTRQTIRKVEGQGRNLTIAYEVEMLDKNMKKVDIQWEEGLSFTVNIRDGVVVLDLKSMLGDLMKNKPAGGEMTLTGTPVEIPSTLQPGQSLKDAGINLNIGIIKIQVDINEGQCLAVETITVPAGTYSCHKITQTYQASVMGIRTIMRTISWYAPGIGIVKSETYDKKNTLNSSEELQSIKNEV